MHKSSHNTISHKHDCDTKYTKLGAQWTLTIERKVYNFCKIFLEKLKHTFFGRGVCKMDNDSAMHSTISSAASACSIHQTIASPILVLSGVKSRSMSSSLSLWLAS